MAFGLQALGCSLVTKCEVGSSLSEVPGPDYRAYIWKRNPEHHDA